MPKMQMKKHKSSSLLVVFSVMEMLPGTTYNRWTPQHICAIGKIFIYIVSVGLYGIVGPIDILNFAEFARLAVNCGDCSQIDI